MADITQDDLEPEDNSLVSTDVGNSSGELVVQNRDLAPTVNDPRVIKIVRDVDAIRAKNHSYAYNSVGYPIVQGKYNQEHWPEVIQKYKSMLTTPELVDTIVNSKVPYFDIIFNNNEQFAELPTSIARIVFDTEVRIAISAINYMVDKNHGIFLQMAIADNLQSSINRTVPQYDVNYLPHIESSDLERYLVRFKGEESVVDDLETQQLLEILELTEDDLIKLQKLKQVAIRCAVMYATSSPNQNF